MHYRTAGVKGIPSSLPLMIHVRKQKKTVTSKLTIGLMTIRRVWRAWDGRDYSRRWEITGLTRSGFLTLDWHIITRIDGHICDGAPRRRLIHRGLAVWTYRTLSGWRGIDDNHGVGNGLGEQSGLVHYTVFSLVSEQPITPR
jgi:hypothetical protein